MMKLKDEEMKKLLAEKMKGLSEDEIKKMMGQ